MFYENQLYVNNSKELSIQVGNICHALRGDLEYMSNDDYPEVAIISANLGKVEGLCRNFLQIVSKKGDTKQLLRKIFRYVEILIKYSNSLEEYVTFDDLNTKSKLVDSLKDCNSMVLQMDEYFNKAYSSFLTNQMETPQPPQLGSNALDFQGSLEFAKMDLKKTIKEKNVENISKMAANLRELSITCCNKAHEMQNIIYKNFNEMDAQNLEKINNVCGQVENQTRAVNNLFYKVQKAPLELNDNQFDQHMKQLIGKLDNIKNICTENKKVISMLNNKQVSEQLETYNNILLSYSACVV
eukprot:TRINITY_DN7590_c0_g1_i1.p1 TRINITY_DN7590_c0_g1~~TRINITY_DN7590_c0_g1_i1.p1  ORF type:complete len:298 (+),score=99.84 TRINITY_DN7590_c0_g1_i1:34-927(+)